jgi:apoptotic chromatin condensation inducer in the nucleus
MSTPLAALGNRTPEQLKVAELREELRKRGIQIKGLKKDLVDRLEDVLKQEEVEQQKAVAEVVSDDDAAAAAAAAVPADQSEPVTPVTKKRSKGHDHHAKEEAKDIVVSEPDNAVVASAGTEVVDAVPAPEEGDIVSQSVAESLPGGSEAAALNVEGGADGTGATPLEGEPLPSTIVLSVPAGEQAKDNEKSISAPPALEDLVADLERLEDPNFNKVTQEPEVQQAGEEETGTIGGEVLSGKSTDIVPNVEKGVDEVMGGTEEVTTTTFEETVTTTVEEQVVSVVSDQNVVTVQEEQVVTTSTRVATVEESANEVVITEDTTSTVATVEKTTTMVADGEGVKLDTEAVRLLEDKSDHTIGEASKEDVTEVTNEVSVAETANNETLMDVDAVAGKETILETPKDELPTAVDAGNGKESDVEKPIEETPMDVDADIQKGSKRKDSGWFSFSLDSFLFHHSPTILPFQLIVL